ncbi:CRISPR-associated nuclease/helicase Cas3 subtype I-F/YPEST [Caballeronia calidae]|uniref:CRISPR-associated nuclease/helicase Cas3 subtype I-F/YPEST n=1 Tax=Caballeronia calidae TaxID=1777139 RepID=A0A158BJ84_9BURK|nr:type I-F CRISPR-associated helicase Cas3f [Caballeronia calidae]SAK69407.1 CRISPR-associated nuclease/helicase Cas3 subtype I-F/YPEST [Caballeronia calidae]
MNVLFVAQCTKRALNETRRILDQFAERRGERTWQTPITQAGLDTVRKLLRQSARKNTAVACHWIRGRDHSELMWIVGDARQFNAEGAVPTNTTTNDVLRVEDESTWHRLPAMSALAALAALLHDLGKATQAFQERLRKPFVQERNHYRHEWVSVRLFQAFVGDARDDADWLNRLASCANAESNSKTFEAQWLDHRSGRLLRDGLDEPQARHRLPFATLPPLAQTVAWLILTHHRMPCMPVRQPDQRTDADLDQPQRQWRRFGAHISSVNRHQLMNLLSKVDADWNEPRDAADAATIAKHWRFPCGLPVATSSWRKQAARYAGKLLALSNPAMIPAALDDPFVMHVSRLCLMLADHHYSSIEDEARRKPFLNPDYPLYANTRRQRSLYPSSPAVSTASFNQTLDEHLLGVQAHASLVARSLPTLTRSLPALQNHRGLKKRNQEARFHWQDRAADLAAGIRMRAAEQGAFVVNMASTGCGKTLGNARIMNALADPKRGMRCAFAIGLRTLTMQTGRSFQRDLGLNDDQLAIKVGGAASRALFDYWEGQAEATGSASRQGLLDEGGQVLFEGNDQHPLLQRLTDDPQVRSLIAAPLLVCTVDHLTPATESLRGGRQIAPMLRLMTGDLVLDEPDDFDMADLPALTRLVHWAGLLGARVLLSSATLPPALVQGLFLAYLDGRDHYRRNRGERPDDAPCVACLWVDEFAQTHADCADGGSFEREHDAFAQKRCERLAKAEIRRRAELVELPVPAWRTMLTSHRREAFATRALQCAWTLHRDEQNHVVDGASGKRVSLGLIRMANIGPLFDVARAMYRQGAPVRDVRVHLCVYHSHFPLLARSHIEQQLDGAFDRRSAVDGHDPALGHASVRALLDAYPEPHHMFIVLASPVCEVGRDWDADWAVVEPSSIRSLIQLAGRVRRHRAGAVARANIAVFDTNLRYFERSDEHAGPVFCTPGFEMPLAQPNKNDPFPSKQLNSDVYFHLKSHRLSGLLNLPEGQRQWPIDARPRIWFADSPKPNRSLIELEHGRMRDTMLPRDDNSKLFTPASRDATRHWYVRDPEHVRIWLTGVLPQLQRFRHDPQAREEAAFLPSEDEDELLLHRIIDQRDREKSPYVDIRDLLRRIPDSELEGPGIGPWCHVDLMNLLRLWADAREQSLFDGARKVGTVSLPESKQGWWFHPLLGFNKT